MTIDLDITFRVIMLLMAIGSPVVTWFISQGKATAAEIADAKRHADELASKLAARADELDKRLTAGDLRLSKVEQDLQHIPNKDAVHRIELTIQKLQGDVEQATSQWRGVQQSIQRLEDYLVHMTAAAAGPAAAGVSRPPPRTRK